MYIAPLDCKLLSSKDKYSAHLRSDNPRAQATTSLNLPSTQVSIPKTSHSPSIITQYVVFVSSSPLFTTFRFMPRIHTHVALLADKWQCPAAVDLLLRSHLAFIFLRPNSPSLNLTPLSISVSPSVSLSSLLFSPLLAYLSPLSFLPLLFLVFFISAPFLHSYTSHRSLFSYSQSPAHVSPPPLHHPTTYILPTPPASSHPITPLLLFYLVPPPLLPSPSLHYPSSPLSLSSSSPSHHSLAVSFQRR